MAGGEPVWMPTDIPALPAGARVSYRHYRYIETNGSVQLIRYMKSDLHPKGVLPRGGATECTVEVGGQYYTAKVFCYYKDAFNYKVGRALSLRSALLKYYASVGV